MGAPTLHSQISFCMMNCEPPAFQGNRIPKAFIEISNFMCPLQGLGLLGSLGQIPLLTLIHSKVYTLGIGTCLGMLDNVLESFEPVLPSLWHSGFTWLEPGLYRALKNTLS